MLWFGFGFGFRVGGSLVVEEVRVRMRVGGWSGYSTFHRLDRALDVDGFLVGLHVQGHPPPWFRVRVRGVRVQVETGNFFVIFLATVLCPGFFNNLEKFSKIREMGNFWYYN
jgi:hypothetical protein